MSKRDYYEVLGVTKTASDDDLKKAYRKLSSVHHPDKHPDADKTKHEALFKEVKEAYETLSDPQKRAAYDQRGHSAFEPGFGGGGRSEMDDILSALRAARGGFGGFGGFRGATFHQTAEVQAPVTLKEAFEGFDFNVELPDGSVKKLPIPAGVPDGYRSQHSINEHISLIVTVRIHDPAFRVRSASGCSWHQENINGRSMVVIETGDIETTINVDALDILAGSWQNVTSFEGDTLQIRVPAGFNLSNRLKVKGRGYYHWVHDLARRAGRGDLYVRINPIFRSPKELDFSKVKELYQQVASFQPPEAST